MSPANPAPEVVERLARIETLLEVVHRDVLSAREIQNRHDARITSIEVAQATTKESKRDGVAVVSLIVAILAVVLSTGSMLNEPESEAGGPSREAGGRMSVQADQ